MFQQFPTSQQWPSPTTQHSLLAPVNTTYQLYKVVSRQWNAKWKRYSLLRFFSFLPTNTINNTVVLILLEGFQVIYYSLVLKLLEISPLVCVYSSQSSSDWTLNIHHVRVNAGRTAFYASFQWTDCKLSSNFGVTLQILNLCIVMWSFFLSGFS